MCGGAVLVRAVLAGSSAQLQARQAGADCPCPPSLAHQRDEALTQPSLGDLDPKLGNWGTMRIDRCLWPDKKAELHRDIPLPGVNTLSFCKDSHTDSSGPENRYTHASQRRREGRGLLLSFALTPSCPHNWRLEVSKFH